MFHPIFPVIALLGLGATVPASPLMSNAQVAEAAASDVPGDNGSADESESKANTASLDPAKFSPDRRPLFDAIGLDVTDAELEQLERFHIVDLETLAALREKRVPHDLAPFDAHQLGALARPHRATGALVHALPPLGAKAFAAAADQGALPPRPAGLAVHQLTVVEQAALLRSGALTVTELTRAHLDHLAAIDAELFCVATLLEERALAQAAVLDAEIAQGHWRGPLHGIPYGLKDLVQVDGAPTAWGAAPFKDQQFAGDAPLVARLDAAGAVLIAKLSLGALAMGDVWYGGQTRNPWAPARGSSGSSAGPAAAVAAGGVAFAIGSETLGSIISPSVRCSVTGLRPTFGRVSRAGAMPLSWSMDKLGPLARTIEDAYLVLEAIAGDTGHGEAADTNLVWPDPLPSPLDSPIMTLEAPLLRIGYLADDEAFVSQWLIEFIASLPKGLTVQLVPLELDETAAGGYPIDALLWVLFAESAASFDELTRSGRDDELTRQTPSAWPNTFRAARLIPAVEYIQAQRLRSGLARDFEALLQTVDVLVHRPFEGQVLAISNLTGHPSVVLPVPTEGRAQPQAIALTGRLADEPFLAQLAAVWQAGAGRPFPPAFADLRPAPQE